MVFNPATDIDKAAMEKLAKEAIAQQEADKLAKELQENSK